MKKIIIAWLIMVSTVLCASNVSALPPAFTWAGGGGSKDWRTAGNWTPIGGPPDNNQNAEFNDTSGVGAVICTGGAPQSNVKTVIFDTANVASYTIGDLSQVVNILEIGNGGGITLTNTVKASQRFDTDIWLGNAAGASTITFTNSSTNSLTIAGNIAGTNTVAGTKTLKIAGNGTGGVFMTGNIEDGLFGPIVALEKDDAGILTMSGNNTYTGGTVINGGTLKVGHANAVGTGDLTNNATLNLGTISLILGGHYIQNAGAILAIIVNSASNFGSIISTVAATVDPDSTVAVTVGGSISNGATFKIVDTLNKGIGAVPKTITSTNPRISFTASILNDDLILTASGDSSFSSAGATVSTNDATVGAVLDNINNPSADMTTVINALNTLSTSQVASSLNSMTPTVDGSEIQSAISMLHQITGSTETHLENIRTGSPAGISTGDNYLHGLDIWAQGLGDYAHQDPRGFSNGYNAISWGVSGGADIPLNIGNDTLRMGIGCGYGQTLVRSKDSSGRNNIASIPGTLYFSYENDKYPFYLDTALTFIYNTYNASRAVTVGALTQRTASADYNGQQYSAYLEGGYSFFCKNIRITPLASFQYMHLHTAPYTETGAGALSLSVNSQDYNMAMTGFGAKVAYPTKLKCGTVTPDLHAKWLYDWVGDNQATNATFAGGGTAFPTSGFRAARSAYDMGTKISFKTKYDISLDLDYDFLLKAQYYEHYGSVTVKYSF
jgi:outer membrane autotransporter protein